MPGNSRKFPKNIDLQQFTKIYFADFFAPQSSIADSFETCPERSRRIGFVWVCFFWSLKKISFL